MLGFFSGGDWRSVGLAYCRFAAPEDCWEMEKCWNLAQFFEEFGEFQEFISGSTKIRLIRREKPRIFTRNCPLDLIKSIAVFSLFAGDQRFAFVRNVIEGALECLGIDIFGAFES